MFSGWVRTGGRFTLFTVIERDWVVAANPSVARTVAPAIPASLKPGASWMVPVPVPVPALVVVTEAYEGPETRENVMASPSASVAVSTWFAVVPSSTVMLAGCASTGVWFGLTVIRNGRVTFPVPSVALTEAATAVVDAAPIPGARWMVPVVPVSVVTVMNDGPVARVNDSASPSGSEPEIPWSAVCASMTVMSNTTFSTGARLEFSTRMPNDLLSLAVPSLTVTVTV